MINKGLNKIMLVKKILMLLTENNASDVVSGNIVKRVKDIFTNLYYTDDVTEKNDIGMNQTDKTNSRTYILPYFDQDDDAVTVQILYRMMRILRNYKNTQVRNYDQLEISVKDLLKDRVKEVESETRKIIIDHTKTSYGKVLVTYPDDISPRSNLSKQIKQAQNIYFSQNNTPKESDNYGNYDYPRFKFFSKNKESLGDKQFYVKLELAKLINALVFPNVTVEEIGNTTSSEENPITNNKETKSSELSIKFVKTINTPYGKKHQIELPQSKSYGVYQDAKSRGYTPKLMAFDFNTKNHLISSSPSEYKILKSLFDKYGLNTSELDSLYSDVEEPIKNESEKGLIFTNLESDKIGLSYVRNQPIESKEFLKNLIQYIFYDYSWNSTLYRYEVSADYKQLMMFKDIMERFEFDIKELEKIIKEKIKIGVIDDSEKAEGELNPQFKNIIDNKLNENYPNSKFELYDLQKEGIKFLTSRKYAILGSETGAGKTIQFIYAADLLTREKKENVLIVTLKAVQKQIVQEIIDVLGEEARSEISTDPMNPKRWTILRYPNFSSGNNLENVIDKLLFTKFKVLILDELHRVKHEKRGSKVVITSANIEKISKNIPIRWGATATLSSNEPINVRNQLRLLGHPLGNISIGKFKKEFCGMVLKDIRRKPSKKVYNDEDDLDDDYGQNYGGATKAYVNGTIEQQLEAAENLHRWLSLTGVYIRHSKKDMRAAKGEKMPDANIEKKSNPINKDLLKIMVDHKLKSYKDEDLEISKLIAFRESIAQLKVQDTVNETIKIITENQNDSTHNYAKSKVLIFTNFAQSGKSLYTQLSEKLQNINPKWKVYTYLSGTPKDQIMNVKKNMEHKDSKVLIMSMKMGGTGISFPNTFANMLINDFDWTPESIEQSEGRIFRINTVQNVNIKYMLADGKDQELFEKVELKKKIAEIIQTYRQNYLESENGAEWVSKIVDLQKELIKIDDDINSIVASDVSGNLSESFKEFFNIYSSIRILK